MQEIANLYAELTCKIKRIGKEFCNSNCKKTQELENNFANQNKEISALENNFAIFGEWKIIAKIANLLRNLPNLKYFQNRLEKNFASASE